MSQSRAKKPHVSHFSFLGDCSEHRHFFDHGLLTTTSQLSIPLYNCSNIHPTTCALSQKKKSSSRTLWTAVQRSKGINYYLFSYVRPNLSICFSTNCRSQQCTSSFRTILTSWLILMNWRRRKNDTAFWAVTKKKKKKAIQKLIMLTSSTLSRGSTAAIPNLLHSLSPSSFLPPILTQALPFFQLSSPYSS